MNHTPTPWKVSERKYAIVKAGNDNEEIADTRREDGQALPAYANAAFIVQACNAHEALLELAEAFKSYLEDDSKSHRRTAECYTAACNEILKLAK